MRGSGIVVAGIVVLAGCVGAPPPRPPASDPSSPAAPVAPPPAPRTFHDGPQSLADPLLPERPPLETEGPEDHHHHQGHGT